MRTQVTGSGKTLAFVVPIIEMLLKKPPASKHHVGAIVLSPTRELAVQIEQVLRPFITATNLHAILLTGGTQPAEDLARMVEEGVNVIVATPGRLVDMFNRRPELVGQCKNLEVCMHGVHWFCS